MLGYTHSLDAMAHFISLSQMRKVGVKVWQELWQCSFILSEHTDRNEGNSAADRT
jgi:hypothetical protein